MKYPTYDEYLDAQSRDEYEAEMDKQYENVDKELTQRQRVLLSKCNHRTITLSKEDRKEYNDISDKIEEQMNAH